MDLKFFPSACSVCLQATSTTNAICKDCRHLLALLCGISDNEYRVFSHRWQGFHYLGVYEELLASLLNRGKFQRDYAALKQTATLFSNKREQFPIDDDGVVIPVPMKMSRHMKRGFNQAEILARTIAYQLGLQCTMDLVLHTGKGRVQHSLNRVQRKKNIRQAFRCERPAPKRVYLVDDIYTTGATMNAMCDCLRAKGCEYIEIWVMAMTI